MRCRLVALCFVVLLTSALIVACPQSQTGPPTGGGTGATATDLVFIHHSVGNNWLGDSLHAALLAKSYITEVNEITYGSDAVPDTNRPDSLGSVPGDSTDMHDWVHWFNDYLGGILVHDQDAKADPVNRIVMFKSCYPNSKILGADTEPGDPFSTDQTMANYRAVYRHASVPGSIYQNGGQAYWALEDVFEAHPNTLFIPVTAPPLSYGPPDRTNDDQGHRAREFNNWLKNDWLPSYRTRTGLDNVAVFDLFDVLAYPDNDATYPNRLRAEYHEAVADSHPNSTGNAAATQLFATGAGNFLDQAWTAFSSK